MSASKTTEKKCAKNKQSCSPIQSEDSHEVKWRENLISNRKLQMNFYAFAYGDVFYYITLSDVWEREKNRSQSTL